ncbi:hypothetical protein [Massilia yuzhufengensis]|uniref:Uncharacterized protein n=1 Tax=Massilia yuzhufengensis TaxID=1164594 RepID=A0A1I1SYI0_9BURK|nr:hypothetical protein [Massilia yuzhufengensis]SFD49828.1 hypothetical protein SAMN05216204_12676 [Massilia yuzhufengensis]
MTTLTSTIAAPAARHAATPPVRSSLLHALRPALQWRLMLLWLLALLLPALVAALPFWRMFAAAFDRTVNASAYARRLDLVAITDVMGLHTQHAAALAGGGIVALAMTLLLSPLLTGAAISAARAPSQLGFAALVAGGVHEYGRLLRMLLWAVVPFGVALFLGAIATDAADQHAAAAVLESSASHASWGAMAVAGLLLLLAHATLDAGRAVLALDRRRTSAVLAWRDGLGLLVRRPLATLGMYGGISVIGLGLAGALAVARLNLPALGAGSFLGGLLLAQLAVLALAWMRCARLFGMMEVARGMRPR